MFNTTNKKVSLFLMALAVFYLILSFSLPAYAYVPVDSDMVPIGIGFILLGLAAALFFTKDQESDTNDRIPKNELPIVLGVVGFIILYIFLLEIIGFILVTVLFLFFCSLFLGYKRHIINGIVSLTVPIFIYLLFDSFLQVQLPTGILPF
ncbi:tripartite tricarboxylate transporter TctB family protein [Virgibacillus siamensis]|uniref:tripartite tricarboxylate transporter TctB family protein n=1 Tax=Virgibacillus siamensis TaxID=480071 RepID=UPI0011157C18|nr:tripartite tricarboxylate transporter TctB family protein [Virgibacillus siamensis]